MSLPSPTVVPSANGKLTQESGVSVRVAYADVGRNDIATIHWGIYSGQDIAVPPPTPSNTNPTASYNLPTSRICDGTASVWYRVMDAIGNAAYSSAVQISIETQTGRKLPAAELTAVNASDPKAGMQATIHDAAPFELTLQPTDIVVFRWDIYRTDNTLVSSGNEFRDYLSTVRGGTYTTPALRPVPVDDQYVVLTYELRRYIDGQPDGDGQLSPPSSQNFQASPVQKSFKDLFSTLPAPIFTSARNGILDLDGISGDIPLQIPRSSVLDRSTVIFHGAGQSASGSTIPAAAWVSSQAVISSTPYDGTPVPRNYIDAVPDGGTYTVYYVVTSIGNKPMSPSATVTIHRGQPQPDDTPGTLWGWGDTEYGTLG